MKSIRNDLGILESKIYKKVHKVYLLAMYFDILETFAVINLNISQTSKNINAAH